MPITLLDGILVGFTLVSAMLAMVRGFSREILSIASWIAAAAAAYFFYPAVLPYVQPYVDNEKLAMAAAAGAVFVVALIVVTVITMKIADFIIDSRVGALDRTLGFLYGAARGILVVAVGLLFFNWLVGAHPPAWIADAKSRPLLEDIGGRLQSLLPDDPENSILRRLQPGGEETPEAAPEGGETPATEGGTEQQPTDTAPAEQAPAEN
jgi:membrane protein required for colicin V production